MREQSGLEVRGVSLLVTALAYARVMSSLSRERSCWKALCMAERGREREGDERERGRESKGRKGRREGEREDKREGGREGGRERIIRHYVC